MISCYFLAGLRLQSPFITLGHLENGFGILSDNLRVDFLECDAFVDWGLTNLEGEIFIVRNMFIPIVHLPLFSFISMAN